MWSNRVQKDKRTRKTIKTIGLWGGVLLGRICILCLLHQEGAFSSSLRPTLSEHTVTQSFSLSVNTYLSHWVNKTKSKIAFRQRLNCKLFLLTGLKSRQQQSNYVCHKVGSSGLSCGNILLWTARGNLIDSWGKLSL